MTSDNRPGVDEPAPIIDERGPDPRPAGPVELGPGTANVSLVLDGNHAVAWLTGDIDIASSGHVREVGDLALADNRVDELILDFSKVDFLDSSGLGAVVGLRSEASDAGKSLRLRGVSSAVLRVFELTGTARHFDFETDDPGRC